MSRARPAALLAGALLALVLAVPGASLAGGAGGLPDCRSCHLASQPHLSGPGEWRQPLAQARLGDCPGLAELAGRLGAARARLQGLGSGLVAWGRRGVYLPPLQQGLAQAEDRLRLALSQPWEPPERAAQRLAEVDRLLSNKVEGPLREAQARERLRRWWGGGFTASLLLALAWLVGYRRGLPPPRERDLVAEVAQGRLP